MIQELESLDSTFMLIVECVLYCVFLIIFFVIQI